MNDGTNGSHTDVAQAQAAEQQSSISRRRFVKRAIATAPVLASLPSGAALARTSNVISATKSGNARDAFGRTQCLDLKSGRLIGDSALDLGQPASGWLNAIRDRDYRVESRYSASQISESEMCKKGGSYYYKSGSYWKKVSVPKGMLVSATALNSFAGSIVIKEV